MRKIARIAVLLSLLIPCVWLAYKGIHEYRQCAYTDEWHKCHIEIFNAGGAVVTAIATALLAVITYMLVRLGEEQSKTTRAQLRAYISIKRARLFLFADGRVEAKVEIENTGQTPAYNVRGAQLGRFSVYPLPPIPRPTEDTRKSTSVVGAGGIFNLLGATIDSQQGSRRNLINALQAPNLVFCLNGIYAYEDIFERKQVFEFQLIVGGPSGVRLDQDESSSWAVFCNDNEGNKGT